MRVARWIGATVWASVLLLALAGGPAGADERKLIATDLNQLAIRGYDTVAYFTDGKAVKGSSDFVYVWGDARWQFATAAHRDMFAADPDRYAPQYGGYCAGSMAMGELSVANPKTWTIVNGKLYMFAGTRFSGPFTTGEIAAADANWRSRTQH
jgi:hypothetical protein